MMKMPMIGLMMATGVWLVAGTAQAQEPGPSFDCMAAKTLGEQILCSDPALAERDRLMADTYKAKAKGPDAESVKAAQRAWLKQRDAACGIAGKKAQEMLDLHDVWKNAPCLVRQYDARLAELGAKAPDLVPLPAGVWHPACVGAASEAEDRGIDLTICQAGTAHIPATDHSEPPEGFETEGLFEGFPNYNYYQKVGTLPDGRLLLLTTYNGGGTGFFSQVSSASLKKTKAGTDWLTLLPVAPGGDRCNGGISDVALKGSSLTITRSLTPLGLAEVLKVPEPLATQLPDCAVCCAADLTTQQTGDGEPQAYSVTVQDIEEQALGDGKLEACLGKALEAVAGKTLKMSETAGLRQAITACGKFAGQ